MEVRDVIKIINQITPLTQAVKGDRVGLQVGKKKWVVNKILIALDLTSAVLKEALELGCELIIIHHPFFYCPKEVELKLAYKNLIYHQLIAKKIAVFVTHTSFDQQMNLDILKMLKAKNITDLIKHDVGKIGIVKNINAQEIVNNLQKIFAINNFLANCVVNKLNISVIALCMGAGGSLIKKINQPGLLFITGEMKWNEWIHANEKGINVICFDHSMENYYLKSYPDVLQTVLPNSIKVFITKNRIKLEYNK